MRRRLPRSSRSRSTTCRPRCRSRPDQPRAAPTGVVTDRFTERTPRVAAARRLSRRAERDKTGRFLAEGARPVGEALRYGAVHEVFVTQAAAARHADLLRTASCTVSPITERAAAALSDTVTPQGIAAVCDRVDVALEQAVAEQEQLVVVLVNVADPGNAGTVLRVADAAGADSVVFAGDAVDAHNGKCVRASAGSLFHTQVAQVRDIDAVLRACENTGLCALATDGAAGDDVTTVTGLAQPTAWLFGSEAHGLPPWVMRRADRVVRVPIYGMAESLNLATAAAVSLYASASARRGRPAQG